MECQIKRYRCKYIINTNLKKICMSTPVVLHTEFTLKLTLKIDGGVSSVCNFSHSPVDAPPAEGAPPPVSPSPAPPPPAAAARPAAGPPAPAAAGAVPAPRHGSRPHPSVQKYFGNEKLVATNAQRHRIERRCRCICVVLRAAENFG